MTNIIAVNPIDCNALNPSGSCLARACTPLLPPLQPLPFLPTIAAWCRAVATTSSPTEMTAKHAAAGEHVAMKNPPIYSPLRSTHHWLLAGCRMCPNLPAYFSASLINRVRCTPFVRFVAPLVSWVIAIWAPLVVCPYTDDILQQQPCSLRSVNNSKTSHDATMTNQRPKRRLP